jgi:ribose transport system ATP-binding protein
MSVPAIEARSLSKRFAATIALDNVDLDVSPGEIHAVVGENGAGKSTLIRILGGVHQPDSGSILVAGQRVSLATPHEAIAEGIVIIPQELRLVPALSIAENIALGDLPVRRFGPLAVIDRVRMREQARAVLALLDFAPDPDLGVASLGFAERQLVAIGKGLRRRSRVFILDEPTAALERHEIERLFSVLARMKAQGTAVIYISHRLDEVVTIADTCTVLRDGRIVATSRRGTFCMSDLVEAMSGRSVHPLAPAATSAGEVLMRARPDDITAVAIRAGEVTGLAGLLGSGTENMLRRLFGAARPVDVEVRGYNHRFTHPRDAIAAGVGMVPGERRLGLVLDHSVRDNILLPNLDVLSRAGLLDRKRGDRLVAELMEAIDIRPRQPDLAARALSGGNQQKVILAKWLARDIAVLLLDEPTQGIDVAAKAQLHSLILDFVRRGASALMKSSDFGELTRLCGIVHAVRGERIIASLDRSGGLDEPSLYAAISG